MHASPRRLGGYALAAVASGLVIGNALAPRPSRPMGERKAVVQPAVFDRLAPCYDEEIARQEKTLHVDDNRRRLVARAHGVVLEIAAGTGRNAEFYDAAKVHRLIVTDASAQMLEAARHKRVAVAAVEYVKADAHRLSEAVPSASVDCVVDTFGLCSFEDPAAVLQEVRRVLKPGGVALLLEHGRSPTNVVLNWWLDFRAPAHAERWGCLANRDVMGLVREAAGFDLVDARTAQMGTVFEIAARKSG